MNRVSTDSASLATRHRKTARPRGHAGVDLNQAVVDNSRSSHHKLLFVVPWTAGGAAAAGCPLLNTFFIFKKHTLLAIIY